MTPCGLLPVFGQPSVRQSLPARELSVSEQDPSAYRNESSGKKTTNTDEAPIPSNSVWLADGRVVTMPPECLRAPTGDLRHSRHLLLGSGTT